MSGSFLFCLSYLVQGLLELISYKAARKAAQTALRSPSPNGCLQGFHCPTLCFSAQNLQILSQYYQGLLQLLFTPPG